MLEILKAIAPGVATALGGPLAGMAAGWLASKLGVPADQVQATIAGMKPDDLLKMKEIDIEFQKFMAENGIKLDLAQIAVNQEAARSTNWFVAGGRPFILWTCGVAFAYATILEPLLRFLAQVGVGYNGAFTAIDTSLTMQVLLGLLGLSGLRTYEKRTASEGNR